MGFDAGKCLGSGSGNTFLGGGAGKYTSSGSNSTYIGCTAGHNSSGNNVVAIGFYAGHGLGTKTGSVFIGAYAGDETTSATCTIHIGFKAGCNVTSGCRNILIGTNLVPTLTTGDCNIIIGHDVDVDSSGTCTTFAIGCGTNRWIAGDCSFNTTIAGIATVYGATGIVSATSFYGDGSNLTGISAGGSPEFYTGITSSLQISPLSFESAVHTFPSTSGRQYVIESISVANVDTSVGVGTTVNIIASIEDATAAEQTYIAYNVPIVTGGLIELLKNPIVAGPSDVIKMWTSNDDYTGVSNAADVYINYTEFESTDYISKFASSTTINSTSAVTLYTSTGNPTMIEKIGFANRTDIGDFPVSIKITNGVTTSYLAKNLIIPRYSTVDILDRHKRIETGAKIEVEVGSTNTVDVIISGKKITS